MNGTQYEEFCRLFLADKFGIPIEAIQSRRISSATHPDLSNYKNQIDLYWEDGNELTQYVNIADAKWRGSDKAPIGKVRELQQVKEDINAHKAMMITNIGFTRDAKNFAENHGIALHIVRPNFDYATLGLGLKNREQIQTQLREPFSSSKPAYIHEVVYRAFDLGTGAAGQSSTPGKTSTYSNKAVKTSSNRVVQTSSYTQKVQGRQSRPPTNRQGGGQKGSGYTRSGGRGGFRRK